MENKKNDSKTDFFNYNTNIDNKKSTQIEQAFLDEMDDLKFSHIIIRKEVLHYILHQLLNICFSYMYSSGCQNTIETQI